MINAPADPPRIRPPACCGDWEVVGREPDGKLFVLHRSRWRTTAKLWRWLHYGRVQPGDIEV
jgi:hypothetical protein